MNIECKQIYIEQPYNPYKLLFEYLWSIIKPFLSWRILLCYLPFWFVATGWAWLGTLVGRGWFKVVSATWLGWMWMPWCPEKLITIPCAIWLHKKLFPNYSCEVFDKMLAKEKESRKKK